MKICLVIGILMLWLVTRYTKNQNQSLAETSAVSFTEVQSVWVDSVLANLTLSEKVAQMFMYVVHEETEADTMSPSLWARKQQIGGVAFEFVSPEVQYALTRHYQSQSPLPLLIGMYNDETNLSRFHMADHWELSAVNDPQIIDRLGLELTEYVSNVGTQVYFGSKDPYVKHTVGPAVSVSKQMLERHILTCIAYDPSYLPSLGDDPSKADSLLYPYKKIAKQGIAGMLLPNTLAGTRGGTELGTNFDFGLKQSFQTHVGFQGLLFSRIDPDLDLTLEVSKMTQAGIDIMLVEDHPDEAIHVVVNLVKGNLLEEAVIDKKVRRILQAKYWSRAKDWHTANKAETLENPGFPVADLFNRKLTRSSLTLVRDEQKVVPLQDLHEKRIMLITLDNTFERFREYMSYYSPFHHHHLKIDHEEGLEELNGPTLGLYNTVIVAVPDLKLDSLSVMKVLRPLFLEEDLNLILVNFASPKQLGSLESFPTIIQAYNKKPLNQELSAQLIFGGIGAKGRLPLAIKGKFTERQGIDTEPNRLAYSLPEEAALSTDVLAQIDEIANEGISEAAIPGCQVLVARKGKVVYQKAFGFHTYDKRIPVRQNDLYDLASITKVAATTMATMKLVHDRQMFISDPLGFYFNDTELQVEEERESVLRYVVDTIRYEDYNAARYANVNASGLRGQLPSLQDTARYQDSLLLIYNSSHLVLSQMYNVFNIRIEDLLTHHSGIPLEMPLYPYVHSRKNLHRRYEGIFNQSETSSFSTKVAEDLFLGNSYRDSLWKAFKYSKLHTNKAYHYSDMNMILLQAAIDSMTQTTLDHYLEDKFYKPLGLQTLRFNPRQSIIARRLIPTEVDQHWRRQLLKGYVHDPAAALLGGVGGNAGLFSNSNDLAILFQMLLNGGEYGGETYLENDIIEGFTRRKKGHRGLGFDKPPKRGRYIIAPDASSKSYGHTGFTGTCVWVDPDEELIFVFLSNRIYPSAENWKINQLRIRSRIHQVVYDAMLAPPLEDGAVPFDTRELIGANF